MLLSDRFPYLVSACEAGGRQSAFNSSRLQPLNIFKNTQGILKLAVSHQIFFWTSN